MCTKSCKYTTMYFGTTVVTLENDKAGPLVNIVMN